MNGGELQKSQRQLTDRQLVFIRIIVEGGNYTDAARVAGYSDPDTQGWRLARYPAVQREIKERRLARILGKTAGLALNALDKVLEDPEVSPTARFPYVKLALAIAGYGEKSQETKDMHSKDLSEMTPEELAQTIQDARQARAEIEARMRDVTPEDAQNDGPVIEAEATQA